MREIAIRGFVNDKFNTTFGKGLFRRAVFNGSVEIKDPYTKYLVDYMCLLDWENKAKPNQLPHVQTIFSEQLDKAPDALFSWVQHYDPVTKAKSSVDGFSVYLPNSRDLYLMVNDPERGVQEEWTLQAHGCRSTGQGKPVFIATNMDLSSSLKLAA